LSAWARTRGASGRILWLTADDAEAPVFWRRLRAAMAALGAVDATGEAVDSEPYELVQALDGGPPRPVTPEGIRITWHPVSPDGRTVAAVGPGDQVFLYPLRGGDPEPVRGIVAGDRPVRWSADGRAIFLLRDGELPAPLIRLDLATGRREPWKQFMPSDPAGVGLINPAFVTPDGRHYVYSFRRVLSDLYLAEGLR